MGFQKKKNARTKYRGVYYLKSLKKYYVQIEANGKRRYFGQFTDEITAARAYDEAAKKYHGEFASLNFKKCTPRGSSAKHYHINPYFIQICQ